MSSYFENHLRQLRAKCAPNPQQIELIWFFFLVSLDGCEHQSNLPTVGVCVCLRLGCGFAYTKKLYSNLWYVE